jgi:tetratricopeptide (TPR) repeat protein
MRDALTRQLLALSAIALLLHASARIEARTDATVEEQLQMVRAIETQLEARSAPAEEWQQIERMYSELLTLHPHDASVRKARGEFLWGRGERERAMAEWSSAEEIDPANGAVLEHLGGGWLAAGDARKSAAYYARATRAEPGNAAFHFALANVTFLFRHDLLDATRPDAEAVLQNALTHFAEASRLEPLNADYARAYAETFYILAKPDWPAALAAWSHVLEVSPKKDFALVNLARVHLQLRQFDASEERLSQIQDAAYEGITARIRSQVALRRAESAALPLGSPQ